jgi:single-strand DNA-binding protein
MSLNSVVLMGNLGKDAETRKVGNGSVTCFQIAVYERWKSKDGGKGERTDWFLCEVWGLHGANLGKWLTKGRQVVVRGKLRTDDYDSKTTGAKVRVVKVRVEEVAFAQSAKGEEFEPMRRNGRDNDGTEEWEDVD